MRVSRLDQANHGFSRVLRVGMALTQREVPKDESQLRAEASLYFFDDRIRPSAVRTPRRRTSTTPATP